jgi:hypothetical protein
MKTLKVFWISLLAVIWVIPLIGQSEELNMDEKKDLMFMMEEEKLAMDVYTTLGEKWDLNIFTSIRSSEERHLEYVIEAAKTNDLEVPTTVLNKQSGEFTNEKIKALYDELISKGSESKIDALRVGAKIEEMDIRDLQEAKASTQNDQLLELYTPLC